ncbi:MAG: phosphoglycerate kinase [Candidatus Methanoperedens nitroreducens]|uniref:Phosphoglycerate kinase n=1 Tax=Candidatus Methanoperedens nitratireducens TaxID=1392998 RepID=A0A0P8AFX7_9EURY|nr:phosphoglycerate kinase [Candidatus Methanoperedens sp. BLZ2]KAB2947275.1 MAG: phosphoglycerate kinase [Candidatus Methanoperedens sp.]KPQ43225.1 MAG: phosphoglycerate kinase [Candidatus Methanoperedens sp. BLZ1]MBZ0175421.1 phosphoglycerate kinase [Candidatus Methanoperedens nitroreducens]MCX9079683.1 phosphoglycerate kinase [Candidatus Methanoperedens sp.]
MTRDYLTVDDINTKGKTVLCRLDLNSPMDPNGIILDDSRFRSHHITLKELENSKVVILSHQSRPGKSDFTTMEPHARLLSKLMKRNINYIDDIFGSHAIDTIKKMSKGDIILLENTRFYSEESIERAPKDHKKTHMVRRLAAVCDIFLNDAFSVSHRSHLSVTGFTESLPSIAGRIMEKEIDSLNRGLSCSERPCVYVLGGTKVDDSIKVTKNVLERGCADRVLVTGVVANVFLAASGVNIGDANINFIDKQGYLPQIDIAKSLLKRFPENIGLPVDVALNKNDERIEEKISNLRPELPIHDIGIETMVKFSQEISDAKTVVMNGPAGVFENEPFALGTRELIKAGSKSGFSVIGGGHIAAAAEQMGISDKFSHVSTGGGACIDFLAGEKLPGIEALKDAARKYRQK